MANNKKVVGLHYFGPNAGEVTQVIINEIIIFKQL